MRVNTKGMKCPFLMLYKTELISQVEIYHAFSQGKGMKHTQKWLLCDCRPQQYIWKSTQFCKSYVYVLFQLQTLDLRALKQPVTVTMISVT